MRYHSHTSTFAVFRYPNSTQARSRLQRISVNLTASAKPVFGTVRNNTVLPRSLRRLNGTYDARHPDTDRGHIIALEFGGPDSDENLVPMWGQFNKHGAWKQFERDLPAKVDEAGRNCILLVEFAYSNASGTDPRIPTALRVTLKTSSDDGQSSVTLLRKTIPHPKPVRLIKDANPARKTQIAALNLEMKTAGKNGQPWKVEDHLNMDGYPSYRKKPAFPQGSRPYAFLDFELWKQVRHSSQQLARWNNDIISSCTAEFTQEKIAMVRLCNRIMNDGGLVSDDSDDPYQELMLASSDRAPQVDHVIAKSRSGPGCYSNAMLLSSKCNNQKKARISEEDQAAMKARKSRKAPRKKHIYRSNPY